MAADNKLIAAASGEKDVAVTITLTGKITGLAWKDGKLIAIVTDAQGFETVFEAGQVISVKASGDQEEADEQAVES